MNAVFLFSYGHLRSIDDLKSFYEHLLRNHYSADALNRGQQLFKSLGTADPLTSTTKRIGEGLSRLLAAKTGEPWKYYIGTKHSKPFVKEAVEQCLADGVKNIVTVSLTPLASLTGTTAYEREVEKAVEGKGLTVTHLGAYGEEPRLIDILSARLADALQWLPKNVKGQTELLFTAHSMPGVERVHADFIRQYRSLASSVSRAAGIQECRLAYRSGGRPPQKWLGPDILDVIRELAAEGKKAIVVCELLSVVSNAEVIQEVGRDGMQLARSLGMEFVQVEYLNDGFEFVCCLSELCLDRLGKK